MKRLLLALLLVSLVAAGCGDDKDSDRARTGDDAGATTSTSAANGTSGTNPDGSPATPGTANTPNTNPDGSPAAPAPGSGGSTTTSRPPFPVKLALDKTCVRKGATGDTQKLRITTRGGDTVGFSTEYSDQSNELSNPNYKSGSGMGKADAEGKYEAEWKVPDIAPNGVARVHVIADQRIHPPLEFRVVGPTDSC